MKLRDTTFTNPSEVASTFLNLFEDNADCTVDPTVDGPLYDFTSFTPKHFKQVVQVKAGIATATDYTLDNTISWEKMLLRFTYCEAADAAKVIGGATPEYLNLKFKFNTMNVGMLYCGTGADSGHAPLNVGLADYYADLNNNVFIWMDKASKNLILRNSSGVTIRPFILIEGIGIYA